MPSIHTLSNSLLAALATVGLCSCSSVNYGVERLGEWANNSSSPLLPTAIVQRKQSYPVSSQAPIFVQGEDPVLVETLATELRVHFSSVTFLRPGESGEGDGFALVVHTAGASTGKTEHASASVAPTEKVSSSHGHRQLNINITDRYSNATFDRINIDLLSVEQSDTKRGQKNIQRAFKRAAALLAGQS